MISGRTLTRGNRKSGPSIGTETITVSTTVENGPWCLKPEHYDVRGWPPESREIHPLLEASHDTAVFYGLLTISDYRCRLLGNRLMGRNKDQPQLKMLHISHEYRDQGLGQGLFDLARNELAGVARSRCTSRRHHRSIRRFLSAVGVSRSPEPDPDCWPWSRKTFTSNTDLEMRSCPRVLAGEGCAR